MIVRQTESCVVSDYADRIGLVQSISDLPMDLFSQEVDVDGLLDSVKIIREQLGRFEAYLCGLRDSDKK